MAYSVLRDGPPILPKIKVVAGGQIAFNAMDVGPRSNEPSRPGEYVATAWIPGNFLNEGLITVDAALCSIDSPKLHHHVSIHEAVSFHVQDPRRRLVPRDVHRSVARGRAAAPRLDDRGAVAPSQPMRRALYGMSSGGALQRRIAGRLSQHGADDFGDGAGIS